MKPPVGSIVVDTRTGHIGVVMGEAGPYLQLRAPRGGREWDCPPDRARSASVLEELRAKVAEFNAARRWTR